MEATGHAPTVSAARCSGLASPVLRSAATADPHYPDHMNDSVAASDSAPAPAVDLGALQVAVIGAGNMGGPVARTMLVAGVQGEHLLIANSSPASSERAAAVLGATAASSRSEALAKADVVVLGVKPYQVLDLAVDLREELAAGAIVISLAAGITLAQIEQALPDGTAVVRAMPNTPISVGEGAVGLMRGGAVTDAQHQLVHALFSRAGMAVDITEEQVHAFIGAAGSLPAFVFTIIEAMTDEGGAAGDEARSGELAGAADGTRGRHYAAGHRCAPRSREERRLQPGRNHRPGPRRPRAGGRAGRRRRCDGRRRGILPRAQQGLTRAASGRLGSR